MILGTLRTFMLVSGVIMAVQSLLLPSITDRLYFLFAGAAFISISVYWGKRKHDLR
jgi:hypothetical protein